MLDVRGRLAEIEVKYVAPSWCGESIPDLVIWLAAVAVGLLLGGALVLAFPL